MNDMLIPRVLALAAAIALAGGAAPPTGQQGSAQLKAMVGGRLIDGFGGTPIRNSVILIEGERIKAVGQVGQLQVPAGAEVISTEGMSVLPANVADVGSMIALAMKVVDREAPTTR